MSAPETPLAVLAIDPGPKQSAMVSYSSGRIYTAELLANDVMLHYLRTLSVAQAPLDGAGCIVIEKVESFGMAVGAEVFETVYWSGRFAEAAHPIPVHRIGRKAVKLHLCQSMRAKDANIRQALIDRYGGPDAIGRKHSPGPLYGISGDLWSALAVAVTFTDTFQEEPHVAA